MQNVSKSYSHIYNLLASFKAFSFVIAPAAGWFKAAAKETPKAVQAPRPAVSRVLSPDCVHLRAGAKKDPLRKNPAP